MNPEQVNPTNYGVTSCVLSGLITKTPIRTDFADMLVNILESCANVFPVSQMSSSIRTCLSLYAEYSNFDYMVKSPLTVPLYEAIFMKSISTGVTNLLTISEVNIKAPLRMPTIKNLALGSVYLICLNVASIFSAIVCTDRSISSWL